MWSFIARLLGFPPAPNAANQSAYLWFRFVMDKRPDMFAMRAGLAPATLRARSRNWPFNQTFLATLVSGELVALGGRGDRFQYVLRSTLVGFMVYPGLQYQGRLVYDGTTLTLLLNELVIAKGSLLDAAVDSESLQAILAQC